MDSILRRKLILNCSEDYLGLWEVIRILRRDKKIDPKQIQKCTLDSVRQLLEEKLIEAGNVVENNKFEAWNLDSDQILTRIKLEWDSLGREPDVYDIVWFNLTVEGADFAKSYLEE